MRYLIPALVVTIVGFSTAQAAPAKSPFSNKSLGEGGGYTHPTPEVGKFFETKPERPPEDKPAQAKPQPIAAKVQAEAPPKQSVVPSRPRPRPFAPAVAASGTLASDQRAPQGAKPPVAEAEGSMDSASDDARRDYETRLFGAAPAPRRAELADPSFKPASETVPPAPADLSVPTGEGMLFVSLELDPQEAGALRDAVAGLGSAAAFRPDARFQPMPGAAGSVRISGWLPASRLGDAIARPGVKRVEVERGSRPAGDSRLTANYQLTLRVADASRPDESIAESVREVTAATGFTLERVFGVEKSASGHFTALVSGKMPVSQLSRAMGLSGVVNIVSAPPVSSPEPVPAETAPKKEGFIKFVMGRGLWLVLLTILLALPAVGEVIRKGLAVFVPYR